MSAATKHTKTGVAVLVAIGSFAISLIAQSAPDRTRPPMIGPPPRLNLPDIQRRMLSNGLAVWLVESHEVPLVQINLLLKAGAGDDPAGKFGLASLTAAMLDEGAGSRSAIEVSTALQDLGVNLSTKHIDPTFRFEKTGLRIVAQLDEVGFSIPKQSPAKPNAMSIEGDGEIEDGKLVLNYHTIWQEYSKHGSIVEH